MPNSENHPVQKLAVSKKEAAQMLSYSEKSIERLIAKGLLRDCGEGKVLIPVADLHAFVNRKN